MTTALERFEATPTPRTDEQKFFVGQPCRNPAIYCVPADFARALERELSAAKSVLTEIVREFDNTYDASQDAGGRWTDAASIPVELMERAGRMVRS